MKLEFFCAIFFFCNFISKFLGYYQALLKKFFFLQKNPFPMGPSLLAMDMGNGIQLLQISMQSPMCIDESFSTSRPFGIACMNKQQHTQVIQNYHKCLFSDRFGLNYLLVCAVNPAKILSLILPFFGGRGWNSANQLERKRVLYNTQAKSRGVKKSITEISF